MSSRPVRSRVVGALSITYGVLVGLFWAWILLRNWGTQERGESGVSALLIVLFVAAPVLLVVVGYALYSARITAPDAQALKVATVVVLAIKAVVAGYWAVRLILATGAFSGLVHPIGWSAVAIEVVPSAVWAVVLALTSIPTAAAPAPEKPPS